MSQQKKGRPNVLCAAALMLSTIEIEQLVVVCTDPGLYTPRRLCIIDFVCWALLKLKNAFFCTILTRTNKWRNEKGQKSCKI